MTKKSNFLLNLRFYWDSPMSHMLNTIVGTVTASGVVQRMKQDKKNRTLEIFFRAMRGEDLSPAKLAESYGVSTKSVTRSINEIMALYS